MSFYVLGEPCDQLDTVKNDVVFSCYRHGFPASGDFANDVGWGCTLRCFQMVIANVLCKLHVKSRVYPADLILDDPAVPFSIQKLTEFGARHLNLRVPDWYGPLSASLAVQACASNWSKTQDDVNLDIHIHGQSLPSFEKPVLFVFPVRLGIKKLDVSYHQAMVDILKHPLNFGIVGGRNTSSFYFIGVAPDGKPLYLDPHILRPHGDGDYSCDKLRNDIAMGQLNPMMALLFVLHNREDYQNVISGFPTIFETCPSAKENAYDCVEEDDFCLVQETVG